MRSVLLQLWRLLDPRQKRRLVLLQFISVFMAFTAVLGIVSVMPFFAVLAEPSLVRTNPWLAAAFAWSGVEDERQFVLLLGLVLIGLIVFSNVVNLVGTMAMTRFSFWVGNSFTSALFEEYLNRDYLFHARTNSATLVNNTIFEVGRVMSGVLTSGISLVTNAVTIAAIVISIFVVNPEVALVAVLALGGSYVLVYLLVRRRLLRNGRIHSQVMAERWKVLHEGFGGIKEILVLGVSDVFARAFNDKCWQGSRVAVSTNVIAGSPKYILECIAVGGLVVTALFLSRGSEQSGAWMAQLTFFGLAAYRLLPALQALFNAVARMRGERASLDRIQVDLDQAMKRVWSSRGSSAPRARVDPRRDIELRGVEFRYQPDRPLALRGVDLRIAVGTSVALVGPSGSGKTTAADVLLSLLSPSGGQLLVDGVPITSANRAGWQAVVGYVPQTIFLTDSTIAENIALGVPRGRIDMEQVRCVGRMAQIDEFVAALPKGYDEIVGERGVRLSGGQRQRIGIARALYRNASVLVMDEATSALDGLTEQEVMSAIEGLQGQRTIILIAHRLTTVRHCDRIFEFEEGRVVRSGTYEELLEQSERFRRMAGEPPARVKA